MSLFFEAGRVVALSLVLAFACDVAHADAIAGNWRFATGDDGLATASLHATNKLITGGGALSYSPVLTIACRTGSEPRWTEWLQIE
ncbi:hypothetical protein ACVDG5_010485 [Mesorhizobium sp. ORM6]